MTEPSGDIVPRGTIALRQPFSKTHPYSALALAALLGAEPDSWVVGYSEWYTPEEMLAIREWLQRLDRPAHKNKAARKTARRKARGK